jgi:toxin ParE1/3/4
MDSLPQENSRRMASFLLRPEARSDLGEIWDYTVGKWDDEQAERYLHLLNRSFVELSKNPTLGRDCGFIRAGYRKHLVGRHVVFYRTTGEAIDVVRILHQTMDFERHL